MTLSCETCLDGKMNKVLKIKKILSHHSIDRCKGEKKKNSVLVFKINLNYISSLHLTKSFLGKTLQIFTVVFFVFTII